jgi:Leucine-rich repeat (LRR) protein
MRKETFFYITALSKLPNLTELWLPENQISDISPLSSLTNLTKLFLYSKQVSDISAVPIIIFFIILFVIFVVSCIISHIFNKNKYNCPECNNKLSRKQRQKYFSFSWRLFVNKILPCPHCGTNIRWKKWPVIITETIELIFLLASLAYLIFGLDLDKPNINEGILVWIGAIWIILLIVRVICDEYKRFELSDVNKNKDLNVLTTRSGRSD